MRFKPYKVEYAKSGRSKCKKKCEKPIEKNELRMSIRNRKSEHPQENWHHYDCFWTKIADPNIGKSLFDGIELLRSSDQETIQNDMKINRVKYQVDYAKTARTECKRCQTPQTLIEKGVLRMSQQMPSEHHEGLGDNWYHFECFWGILSDTVDERTFHGIKDLRKEDAEKVHNRIKSIQEKFERKKRKSDEEIIPPKKQKGDLDSQEQEKVQTEHLCNVVDYFKQHLKPEQIRELLNDNKIPYKSVRKTDTINCLADCAVFGVPITNHRCVDGFLFYSTAHNCYKCCGRKSDYDPCCFYRTNFPKRKPFLISDDLKKAHNFLAQLPKLPYRQISKELKMNRTSMENSQTPSTSRAASQVKSSDETVKLPIKNGCAVDLAMDNAETWHVYMDNEGHLWDANLNRLRYKHQSFYKIQLLKHDINKDE
uniref:NAD(+) ADP-ribosyltransferase n=1 Tax=Acrobeloides nanus TaxID=290746 RepID=A0A914C032_9BILA